MRTSPIIESVKKGPISIDIHRYHDGRYGFEHTPPEGKRQRIRANDLVTARQKAKGLLDLSVAGRLDLLEISREDYAEFVQWKRNNQRPQIAIPELVSLFLTSKATKGVSVKHLRDLRGTMKHLALAFPGNISALRRQDVETWLDSRKVGNYRWNNMLAGIKSLVRFASDSGYISSESSGIDKILKRKTTANKETYTPEELKKLLSVVPYEWKPAIIFGAFCGIRPEEICSSVYDAKPTLQWENILWDKKKIDVPASVSKVRRRRFVPLHDTALEWLKPWRHEKGPVVPRAKMSDKTASWGRKAGVKWKFDALRHSYASYRLALTQDIQALRMEMGNSEKMIHDHYLELKFENEAMEWFGILPEKEN